MHAIERELVKVSKYKVQRKFDNRQDYLKSLLNAVSKMSDEDFEDNISDESAGWYNKAVEALNTGGKADIPDFDELEASDEENEASDADGEVDEDDAEESSDAETDAEEDESEDDPSEAEVVLEDDEAEEKPKKGKAKAAKPAKALKPEKAAPKPAKRKASDEEDVQLDKFGCMEGSKNSRALAMFEKSATAKEVKDSIGGTYYNILKKVVADGHQLTKEGAIMTLTHKDAKKAPKAAVAKKGKK